MDYEWNPEKAERNLEKHSVSFEEAATVFDDPLYVDFFDPDHSTEENRYIVMGLSHSGRILFVSYIIRVVYRARRCNSADQRARSDTG